MHAVFEETVFLLFCFRNREEYMIRFGTGGWRAVIGEEYTKENLEKLSLALSYMIRAEHRENETVVIGYDRRFLSKESAVWVSAVLASQSVRVRLINHSVPTPAVMYYVKEHHLSYGLMITASHNPALYNGVKVFVAGGRDAGVEVTALIESYLESAEDNWRYDESENGQMPTERYLRLKKEGWIEEIDPIDEYIDGIINDIDMDAIRKRKPYIAADPMHGVSLQSLNTILTIARCRIDAINTEHDALFGGLMPAPNSATIRRLQTYVLDKGCDIGIATDGDADRLGVIDDQGRFLHANDILVMVYYYFLKYKGIRGPAVRNIATTVRLDRLAEQYGQKCYEVPVGFKYISAAMAEYNAVIGGESSGGIAVKGRTNGKDGIFSACLLVEMTAVTGKNLSELAEEVREAIGMTHVEERDYRFRAERREALKEQIRNADYRSLMPMGVDRVEEPDGTKVYFEDSSWLSIRFSGTEPVLRMFCETEKREDAVRICEIMENYLSLK